MPISIHIPRAGYDHIISTHAPVRGATLILNAKDFNSRTYMRCDNYNLDIRLDKISFNSRTPCRVRLVPL